MRRPSLNLKPVVAIAKKVCPNPTVSVSLPPKLTFGCR